MGIRKAGHSEKWYRVQLVSDHGITADTARLYMQETGLTEEEIPWYFQDELKKEREGKSENIS